MGRPDPTSTAGSGGSAAAPATEPSKVSRNLSTGSAGSVRIREEAGAKGTKAGAGRERSLSHGSSCSSGSEDGDGRPPRPGRTRSASGGQGPDGPPAVRRGPSHLDEKATRRSKIMMRLIAFFYHLSLSIHFTVWTELLLDDFDGDFSKASDFLGMCNGIERGIQFLTAPFLGNLSDCLGRQPIMLLSLLLNILALLVVILHPNARSVMAYYVINGFSNVTWAMLNAIVADLAVGRDDQEGALTQQYGRLGMAVGLAMIFGPLTGPQLQKLNVVYPLYGSMAFLLISVVLGYTMAESLPPQNKNAFKLASSNPFWALKKAIKYRGFLLFAVPFFLTQMSECVYSFIVLYTKRRFHWDYALLGIYIAGLCLAIALMQGNLRYMVPRFISEKGCVLFGSFMHGVSMFVTGASFAGWMMLVMVLPRMLAAFKLPGLMGVMSRSVVHEDQGVLQGSIMSLRVLAKAVATPLFGKIFKHVFNADLIHRQGTWVTGITFFVAGGFDLLACALAGGVFLFAGPGIATAGKGTAGADADAQRTAARLDEKEEGGTVAASPSELEMGVKSTSTRGVLSNGHGRAGGDPGGVGDEGKDGLDPAERARRRDRAERREQAMLQLEGAVDDYRDVAVVPL